MDYQVTSRQLSGLKVAFWWNAIVVGITLVIRPYSAWWDGASFAEAMIVFIILAIMILPVLALNYVAYNKTKTAPSSSNTSFGLAMAIIGLFFLNIIGSAIAIFYYVKIKRENKTIVSNNAQIEGE